MASTPTKQALKQNIITKRRAVETKERKVLQSKAERKRKKNKWTKERRQQTVYIGRQKERWCNLKTKLGLVVGGGSADETLAQLLLDTYEGQGQQRPREVKRLPITNNLMDLTSNGKFDDKHTEQKPILQQDEKKIDIVPQTCCIKIEVESEAHSDHGNLLKKEVDCAQVSLIDISTNLPKLENITSDSDTVLQTCNIKLESSVDDFFDGGNYHLKKEVDYAQMSLTHIPGVKVFCNGSVAELEENKEEENTTACSGNGAMHSQISVLNEKSQCELSGAEIIQDRNLMVQRSLYHRQDQQILMTQDSNLIEEKVLGIDHFNDGNCINSHLHETVIYSKTKNSHKCSVCNKTVNHLVILKTLQGINTGQKIYKCFECKIDLSSKLGYQDIHSKIKPEMSTDFKRSKNLKIYTGDKPYKCKDCNKSFNQSSNLKEHIRVHTGEKPYRCTDCGRAFNQSCTLKTHQNIHKGIKPYKCNTCDKAFSRPSQLKTHIRIHTEGKPYSCTDCGKAFGYSSSLNRHQIINAGEKSLCKVCGKSFNHSCHLKAHLNMKPYKCNTCGKVLTRFNDLKRHIKIHIGEKPYRCADCGKTFIHLQDLKRHQKIHKGIKPYRCNTCGKAFCRSSNLKVHNKRIHTGEKPYRCTDCGKAFGYSYLLNEHNVIHVVEKSLCKVCGKYFNQSCHLKTHQNVEKGIKPYKCNTCGKAFTQPCHLKEHLRIHTGEKPYRCTDCGKAFNRSFNLKTHQNIHNGIKPYKCNTCGKAYRHTKDLKLHNIRIHTGEKPYRAFNNP